MGFGGFVRTNLAPAAVAAVGAMVGVWGFTSDAYEMWTAGIKPESLQLTGFVLFVVGVVAVLYRQHQTLESRLSAIAAQHQASSSAPPPPVPAGPTLAPTAANPPAEKTSGPEVGTPKTVRERKPNRQYVPDSFAASFAEFLTNDPTELQYEAFLRPHVGQWIRVSGQLLSLGSLGDATRVTLRLPQKKGYCRAFFGPKWKSQLAKLSIDDPIQVEARITARPIYKDVQLTQAELL